MEDAIYRKEIVDRIRELMDDQHEKMDKAKFVTPEAKSRSEGYLEALYQVENVLINI